MAINNSTPNSKFLAFLTAEDQTPEPFHELIPEGQGREGDLYEWNLNVSRGGKYLLYYADYAHGEGHVKYALFAVEKDQLRLLSSRDFFQLHILFFRRRDRFNLG